ncbi:hypothetical protein ADL27_04395 [Streptomyces sp. NRRL F-6602]|nr:hypothetical protein ADL27_04395 [Streptomyces sp. NRRL F-6602]
MATVSDGDADRYRAAQRALTRLLLRDARGARRLLVPSRLRQTMPDWIAAVHALVTQYGRTSAALGAEWYDAQRAAARAPGPFTVPIADGPPEEQTTEALRWATNDLWPSEEGEQRASTVLLDVAFKKADGAAQKMVADQGRATVRQAARQDRAAVGYARAAALGACSFCKLMASRGMVYKTAQSAGRDANDLFKGDASVVKFHDNCHCALITVFRGQTFELSPHASEWDRLYREYAAPYPGDQLRRFRRALAEHDSNPLPGSN